MSDTMRCSVVRIDDNNNVHTEDINFGPMQWFKVEGRNCCSTDLTLLGHRPEPMYVGDGFCPVDICIKRGQGEAVVHARHKYDVLKIARSLSKDQKVTTVVIHSRVIARFEDGELIGDVRTLDEFYNNLSEEEVNETDLTGTLDDPKES